MDIPIFSSYILPATLAAIMLGMGLSLTKNDFKFIFIYPKAFFVGLSSQMLILPALAFFIAEISGLPPFIQVGIVLIAACPGGASSNLIVHLLKGNVALSVAMTSINSFITLFTIPVLNNLALGRFLGFGKDLQMPFISTVTQILLITVLPVSVGIIIRSQFKKIAIALEKPLKIVMPVTLAFAILGTVFYDNHNKVEYSKELLFEVLPWIVALNIIGMITGFLLALLFKLGKRNQITVAIEVGLQNSGLAIAIAVGPNLLNNSQYAVPATIYAMFTFFTAVIFGIYIKRRNIGQIAQKIPQKVKPRKNFFKQ